MSVDRFELIDDATERTIVERCLYALDLEFFGVSVRLHVRTAHEAEQWRYFYRYHLGGPRQPAVELYFEVVERADSFIESIFRKDYSTKAMYVRVAEGLLLWARFDRWSSVPSPLPPFTMSPLNSLVWALNASAVQTPCGHGMLFVAAPYQGKSTLVNAIVRQGGAPLADNVTVLSTSEPVIHPHLTPTGVREETIPKLPGLSAAVAEMCMPFVTVSEVTGKVYLLHFDEIMSFSRPSSTRAADIVFVENHRHLLGRAFKLDPLDARAATALLDTHRVDTGLDRQRASALLRALCEATRVQTLRFDLPGCELEEVVQALLA